QDGFPIYDPRKIVALISPGLLYSTLLVNGSGFPFQWPQPGTVGDLFNKMLGGNFRRFLMGHGWSTPFEQAKIIVVGFLLAFPLLLFVLLLFGFVRAR
ncbi:MAG: hypothetical protein ABEJ65_10070, partial [bacterium]